MNTAFLLTLYFAGYNKLINSLLFFVGQKDYVDEQSEEVFSLEVCKDL